MKTDEVRGVYEIDAEPVHTEPVGDWGLLKHSQVERALSAATSPEQTKEIEAVSRSGIAWAKEQKNYEMLIAASHAYIMARRRTTELILPTIKHGGDRKSDKYQGDNVVTLIEFGFTRKQWERRVKELEIDPGKIESYFDECIEMRLDPTVYGLVRYSKWGSVFPGSSVTYRNQPAIDASGGSVPLAGTAHVYTVAKQLWPEEVEQLLSGLLLGESLHLCSGKSKLGSVRLDLHEPDADIHTDAAHTGLESKSYDTVLCDPPYNGDFQWNHDLLDELARLARSRIIFQHWFIPADPDGLYKKANRFHLSALYVWQPRTYFGRAQLISVFDWSEI